MTFLGSRFWDSPGTSHSSNGSMSTRADAVFSFVSTRGGHFERQGWSDFFKAVFVIGALLLAYPMAMAQDVVQLGPQPPAEPGQGGNGGNPFSGRYVVTFSPGTDSSKRAEVARDAGAQLRHNFTLSNAITVTVQNENTLNSLRNNRSVLSVSPEGVMRLFAKKPSAPSNLAASVNAFDEVDLVWTDNSSGNGQEGGFEIQRCSGAGCGSFVQIFVTAPDVTTYNDPGLPPDSYSYRVRANNSGNGPSSQWSNTDTVVVGGGGGQPPAAPTGLGAGSTSDTSVSVGWVDNANNETAFEIVRCTGGGCNSFTQIDIVAADVVLYSDTGLTASTAYSYRVRATNADGNSAYSNIGDVTTAPSPGPPLPPPPNERGTRQQAPYGVIRVGIPTATSNGLGIGVAVVDTGIYFDHEDLDPAPDVPAVQNPPGSGVYTDGTSYNGSFEGDSARDTWGHGTHVAGRIAALDNNYGTLGVAPHATLYAVKVDATPAGEIATTDIIAGLEWIIAKAQALTPPIRVVNISSGGPFENPVIDQMYHDRIIDLYNMDIVVVVSAGNTPTVEVSSLMPAAWAETITVAATVASDGLAACAGFPVVKVLSDTAASFTTDGTGVDISAPGAERTDAIGGCTGFFYGTLSTTSPANEPPQPDEVNGTYGRKIPAPLGWLEARGTSFSAPLVAGVVARILQLNSILDVEGVRLEIGTLADRVGEAPLDHPWDGSFGVTYTYDGEREGIAQAPQ